MTRDQRSSPSEDGLPVDRLLFDMIRDLIDRADGTQHLLGKVSAQVSIALEGIGTLEDHVMHLSKQGIGHTERLRRLEMQKEAKEETLWAETLGLFSPRQRIILVIIITAVLLIFGVLEPADLKHWALAQLGAPPN